MFESDKKYMTLKDVKLKQPLSEVKLAANKKDTLVIPENFENIICRFFEAAGIKYETIRNPKLYPKEKLRAGLQRFEVESEYFEYEDPVLFISQFDANALFDWTKQLYGDTVDESYQQYLDDQHRQGQEYYKQNIRPIET